MRRSVRRWTGIQWGRVFRQSVALFMATLAAWALLVGSGADAAGALLRTLGENPDVVSAMLQTELGLEHPPNEFNNWERLILSQSAYLRGGVTELSQPPTAPPEPSPMLSLPAGQPAQDRDDMDDAAVLPQSTTAPEDIVERTLIPTSPEGYVTADGLYLYNRTDLAVDLAALAAAPVEISLTGQAPEILIVHTHATEAYTQDGTDRYTPSDNSRTLDEHCNMLRVGDEMERVFTELGLSVLHDRTLYDYPQYSGAYSRSAEGIQQYLEEYPSIKIVLDVHRDALVGEDGTVYKAVTTIDGSKVAQVMLVLGSSAKGEHPNWQQNLTLAAKLQHSMNTLYPTLARPMTLRTSVYNQNLTNGSLLVEVGCHGNTLQEALGGARLFARAAGQVLLGLT
ncbi:MAG: stage II sporulation protein P [Oscillospiraceae bacterium]|nr:stage II sporulation protein P [Oscillospiraceae bacterium]